MYAIHQWLCILQIINASNMIVSGAHPQFQTTNISGIKMESDFYFKDTETRREQLQAGSYLNAEISQGQPMQQDEMNALGEALKAIAMTELRNCSIVVAFDAPYTNTRLIETVMSLPHQRQVLQVTSPTDFLSITWEHQGCQGYFFLFSDPEITLSFVNIAEEPWDFSGKYVLVGFSNSQLNQFSASKKGKKTQHIVGLVQTTNDEWRVYINRLYWGDDMALINRWRKNSFTSNAKLFPDKIYNLKGVSIKMITFEFAPHVIFGVGNEKKNAGRDILVAEALSKVLNFTLKIQEPPSGELWGTKLPNGTWTGLVASLAKNIGHFGMANIFLSNNNDRTLVQGFTRSYDADLSCFMARTDPPLPRWQSLALPFELETWLAVSASLLLFCPLLYALGRLSAMSANEIKSLQYLTTSSLYNWAMHFRQSQKQIPQRPATQIMIVFLWLYVIILTTGYSCNLTAFLTVIRPPSSMQTIKELHASGQEVLGMGYFFRTSLVSSGNVYLKGLADRYHGLYAFTEAHNLLQKGRGVFLESRKYLEYLIGTQFTVNGIPKMRIMRECYSPYSIAVATQKHFPLKRSFDRAIAWIFESGLVRRWFLETLRINKKMTDKMGNEFRAGDEGEIMEEEEGVVPLSIDHMQGSFFILAAGLSLSLLVFSLEVHCHKRK